MNENLVYWIWLQQALKHGNNRVRTVRIMYRDIKDFYNAGEREWRLCGCFTNTQIYSMNNFTLEEAEMILKKSFQIQEIVENGLLIITIQDQKTSIMLHII